MRIFTVLLSITLLISSCTSENKSEVREIYYFDLKTFFSKEADKLSAEQKIVSKSIEHNNAIEKKDLKIQNWAQELALFIESDINKVSWKESYSKDSTANKLIYRTKDQDLRTQSIEISFDNGKPAKIKIINKTYNYLYKTDEVLEYYTDSLYIINKKQRVALLGENDYLIKGFLLQ